VLSLAIDVIPMSKPSCHLNRISEDERSDVGIFKVRDVDFKLFPESRFPVLDEARDALDPMWWCTICRASGKATFARKHGKRHSDERRTLINILKRDSVTPIGVQAEQRAWIQYKRSKGMQSAACIHRCRSVLCKLCLSLTGPILRRSHTCPVVNS
jgi:hypothetical protein